VVPHARVRRPRRSAGFGNTPRRSGCKSPGHSVAAAGLDTDRTRKRHKNLRRPCRDTVPRRRPGGMPPGHNGLHLIAARTAVRGRPTRATLPLVTGASRRAQHLATTVRGDAPVSRSGRRRFPHWKWRGRPRMAGSESREASARARISWVVSGLEQADHQAIRSPLVGLLDGITRCRKVMLSRAFAFPADGLCRLVVPRVGRSGGRSGRRIKRMRRASRLSGSWPHDRWRRLDLFVGFNPIRFLDSPGMR
jgi:hypothetical protein